MTFHIDFDGELKIEEPEELQQFKDGPADFSTPADNQRYSGPERRQNHRRSGSDRRQEIRFETKADRRSGKDRRKGAWDPKYSG